LAAEPYARTFSSLRKSRYSRPDGIVPGLFAREKKRTRTQFFTFSFPLFLPKLPSSSDHSERSERSDDEEQAKRIFLLARV
jgi:hypothetical protein